jgi:Tfp pilus assembly protein PilF
MEADMKIVRSLVIALASLTVSLPAVAQQRDQFGQAILPEEDRLIDRAKTLRLPYGKLPDKAREDARQSITILEPIISSNPEHYRALFNLALAQHEAGNYAQANQTFEQAIAVRQKQSIPDISLLNSAGWVSMENGDYTTAEKRLLMALREIGNGSPQTQASVYNNLGQLYFYTQRFDEAEKYLTIARDKYGSKSAAATIIQIKKTNQLFQIQQQMKK